MKIDRRIDLAGIDLDGTLLRDDKSISQKSIEAIQSAKKRGVHIVPITGRPLDGVPAFIKELEEIEYIITSNGAQITNLRENSVVYSQTISFEKCLQLIRMVQERGFYFEVFADNVGYVDEVTMAFHRKRFADTPLMEYIEMSRRVVDNVYDFFSKREIGADELFIICRDRDSREEFRRAIENDSDIQYCELWDVFIELTDARVDKGKTLKKLCNILDVPIENTIAFGDGENDLPFLKAAGVSVAMSNAMDMIQQNADFITDTNENDGVAKVLEIIGHS